MSKPVAVLISDIHFNINTLPIAQAALTMAVTKSNELEVPLIIAGDLHDTKANLRGECIKVIRSTLQKATIIPRILVGNHDRINEKAIAHSLHFLDDLAAIIDIRGRCEHLYLIAYFHHPEELKAHLSTIPKGSTLIMHQGLQGSNMGDYIQDKSALMKDDLAGFRVISGHYHTRQSISLPDGGRFDYIGNPYTLGWGEANDPPKGFQILMSDGSLEFVPTNLRKHVVIKIEDGNLVHPYNPPNKEDLVWVKYHGTKEELSTITKEQIKKGLYLQCDFKLDLIPKETKTDVLQSNSPKLSHKETLDNLIDSLSNTSDDCKKRLKSIWPGYAE